MMDVEKLLREMVVRELREIKSDIRELRTKFDVEIRRLDEKIDSLRNEMQSGFKRLDEKIDISLDLRDRLAALDAKIAVLSR